MSMGSEQVERLALDHRNDGKAISDGSTGAHFSFSATTTTTNGFDTTTARTLQLRSALSKRHDQTSNSADALHHLSRL